jgi:hypothetical protein
MTSLFGSFFVLCAGRGILKETGEFDPFRRMSLGVKFEFARWAGNALAELEKVKCVKLDSGQFALMYFSHISSTVGRANSGLQNEGRFIGDRAPGRPLEHERAGMLSEKELSRSG